MEQLCLYIYLKFQREFSPKFWEAIKRIPWRIQLLVWGSIGGCITGIYAWCSGQEYWVTIVALSFEAICSAAVYYSVEKYQIKNSEDIMDHYWEYCTGLQEALRQVHLCSREDIEELKARLEKHIHLMTDQERASKAHLEKWLEVLAVPVVLSIMTTIIENHENFTEMIAGMVVLFLAIIVLGAPLVIISSLMKFPQKRKMEQMIEFCGDLQGVLDLERFGTSLTDEEAVTGMA